MLVVAERPSVSKIWSLSRCRDAMNERFSICKVKPQIGIRASVLESLHVASFLGRIGELRYPANHDTKTLRS
jgi:hypothetical protein